MDDNFLYFVLLSFMSCLSVIFVHVSVYGSNNNNNNNCSCLSLPCILFCSFLCLCNSTIIICLVSCLVLVCVLVSLHCYNYVVIV